jgi:hypothetical protein
MRTTREEYRNDLDSVRAFVRILSKSDDSEDRLKFKDLYQAYASFCQKWKMDLEKWKEFKKLLKDMGFEIRNSTKDSNQLYIFNVRLVPEEDEI